MVISHKFKLIFLKTYKTAGTSIEVFLSQHCGGDDVLTPIRPHVSPHYARNHRAFWNVLSDFREIFREKEGVFRKSLGLTKRFLQKLKFRPHMSGSLVRRRVPKDIWNSYFKFCVERNPWDKTLSHFYMLKGRSDGNLTLDEYFQNGDFCLNYPIYTVDDEIIVDRIIKYEKLNNGLNDIFDELGVPFKGELGVRAKSEHRKNESYRDVLNNGQSHTIQNVFRKEIEMHGYSY
jgi:hypothetical protein